MVRGMIEGQTFNLERERERELFLISNPFLVDNLVNLIMVTHLLFLATPQLLRLRLVGLFIFHCAE